MAFDQECHPLSQRKDIQNIEGVSTKQLYWHLIDNISLRPTSENKWNQKLDFIIDVAVNIHKLSKTNKRHYDT